MIALPEYMPMEAKQADLEFRVSLIYLLNSRTRQGYIMRHSHRKLPFSTLVCSLGWAYKDTVWGWRNGHKQLVAYRRLTVPRTHLVAQNQSITHIPGNLTPALRGQFTCPFIHATCVKFHFGAGEMVQQRTRFSPRYTRPLNCNCSSGYLMPSPGF